MPDNVLLEVAVDPATIAERAGLRYVTDDRAGITRRRAGTGFAYYTPGGALIRDPARVARIRSIAIPPAWRDVWICPSSTGHILATGRDARGRKQYRYHPDWRAIRDETKFDRMLAFGSVLPDLRRRIEVDLGLRGIPREKVLAAVLRLIDTTLMRVGNEEYARLNTTFGATTLRGEHVAVRGANVTFSFRGKHGKQIQGRVTDRRLARVVRSCQDLPGQQLFGYVDELGEPRVVHSDDVNDYLRELAGQDFTVKDYRTWGGSVLACGLLGEIGSCTAKTEAARRLGVVVKIVALELGNTPAVCRSSYIHPGVIDRYLRCDLAPSRLDAAGSREGLRESEELLLDVIAEC